LYKQKFTKKKERKKEKDGKKEGRKLKHLESVTSLLHLKGKSRNKAIPYVPSLPKRIILAEQMETYKNLQIFDV
jgi:hypothetical protein